MEKNAVRRVLYRRYGANDLDAVDPTVLLEVWEHSISTCIVLTQGYKRLNSSAILQWLDGYPIKMVLEKANDWELIERARQAYLDLEASLREVA